MKFFTAALFVASANAFAPAQFGVKRTALQMSETATEEKVSY